MVGGGSGSHRDDCEYEDHYRDRAYQRTDNDVHPLADHGNAPPRDLFTWRLTPSNGDAAVALGEAPGMNRFERERVDGIRDGLNIALGALRGARDLPDLQEKIFEALDLAREAINRETLQQLRELAYSRITGAPLA